MRYRVQGADEENRGFIFAEFDSRKEAEFFIDACIESDAEEGIDRSDHYMIVKVQNKKEK